MKADVILRGTLDRTVLSDIKEKISEKEKTE